MARFARIFDLSDGNQILLTREYDSEDDSHEVKVRTEIKKLTSAISLGFETEEKANEVLKNFTLEQAEEIRNQMLNVLQ